MPELTLLVATPGGHIEELYEVVPRLDMGEHRLWVTTQTPQTSRLLKSEQCRWVRPVQARQKWRAAATLPEALHVIRTKRPSQVISTGAALAVPYLTAASLLRVPAHYIESATRVAGPSLTGKFVSHLSGVQLYHQSFTQPIDRWTEFGSVFDNYEPGPRRTEAPRRAVVTVGTERFPFSRALEQVLPALPAGVESLIQTGNTPWTQQGYPTTAWVPGDELLRAVREADLVVTHAGVGSVLTALRAGKHPVLIPRLAAYGEHVDDHQLELATLLEKRGLATVVSPGQDLEEVLLDAAGKTTVRCTLPSEDMLLRLIRRG